MDIYESIRNANVIDYGQKFEKWAPRILVDQYSDRTHFIYELLQNAEDAEASFVSFHLYKDRFILRHDGRAFNENDIRGVCGVSASTKTDNYRIGRFGIGFKSVYAYTSQPHIQSGEYDFIIKNLIMPYPVTTNRFFNQTEIVLPFDEDKNIDKTYDEIACALRRYIIPDCMLTLCHIKKIEYTTYEPITKRIITKEIRQLSRNVQDITVSEDNSLSITGITRLLAFISEEKRPVMIAYKIEESYGEKNVIPSDNPLLYAYFPTAIETHQFFYIHAPFDTTPARDNIKNNDYNKNLVMKLCGVFRKSIDWLRDNKLINLKFFNQVYPIYKYTTDNILSPLMTEGIELLKSDDAVLPTAEKGEYGCLADLYIPESQNILACFDDALLTEIVQNKKARWMDKTIASEPSRTFREYLHNYFCPKVLGWKQLVQKIPVLALEAQSDSWLIMLMRSIQPYCYQDRSEDRIDVRNIPLVRLENGKHCCAQDGTGKYLVYLNNPEACNNTIKASILKDFFAYTFYSQVLGIRKYDIVEEITNEILPIYISEKENVSLETNIKHIKLICKALTTDYIRVRDIIAGHPFISTQNGWKAPEDSFIPYKYFDQTKTENDLLAWMQVNWLTDLYKGWLTVDELVLIGCKTELEPADVNLYAYKALLKEFNEEKYNEYCDRYLSRTYHASRDDYHLLRSIKGLPASIDGLPYKASVALAEYISRNITVYKLFGTVLAANDAALRGKSLYTLENIPSALGLLLMYSRWIYKEDQRTFCSPFEIKRSEISSVYEKKGGPLLDLLPFIHEDNAVQTLLEHYDPRYHEFLTELLNNPNALNDAFSLYSKEKDSSKENNQNDSSQEKKPAATNAVIKYDANDDSEEHKDIERVTEEIMKKAAEVRRRRKKEKECGEERHQDRIKNIIQDSEGVEEDEYTRATVDFAGKIERAKEKSVEEIEKIARYEKLYNSVRNSARYSYGWFCTLLEMEALNSYESSQNSREISVSFGKIDREPGTSRTFVLRYPSRSIPRFLEDLSDIPLLLNGENQTKKVAIEVASVQSYSLRVKLKNGYELDDYDLHSVKEAHIDARNPVFLIDSLYERFLELGLPRNYCMQNNLCENIEFIFGPPGTGKTTYLSSQVILPLLKEDGVRILVLTPTNKAADVLTNRIMAVCDNTSWKEWLIRFGITGDETIEKAGVYRDKSYDVRNIKKSVTITTIARFSYDYFMPGNERLYIRELNWDYIIIDEASMIPIADIVYPLYKKTPVRFIISGDPFQIEPVSTVDLWKDENIYTLVKLNSFTNPVTVPIQYKIKLLTTQYRSVPTIGEVFSRFSYGGVLQHYRKKESQKTLNIDDYLDIQTLNIIKYPVSKYESIYRPKLLQHKTPYHIYSALFTYEYTNYLRNAIASKNPGVKYSIGIIAPYRAQADLIEKLMSSGGKTDNISISTGTIHGFQGDECDIVIVVLNTPQAISESKGMFLNKQNILNVAISRAKDYLYIIMPDDDTENISKLKLVKELESIIKEQDSYNEFQSHEIERLALGNERYIENNTFSTSHQVVNIYGLPESKYEIRSEETAIDIQIHTNKALK